MANFRLDPEQLEYERNNLFVLFNANNSFNQNMAFIKPATFFICIQQLYLDPVFNCCYVNANRTECGHGNLLSLDAAKKFIKAVVERNRLKKSDRLKEIADSIKTVDDLIELGKKYPELFVINDYRGKRMRNYNNYQTKKSKMNKKSIAVRKYKNSAKKYQKEKGENNVDLLQSKRKAHFSKEKPMDMEK